MAAIKLDDVSLTFRVRHSGRVTLKEFVIRQLFRPSKNPIYSVHALSNVGFDLKEGDRLGVIGHNGAGKSTLLKLLAGVYPPNAGKRIVQGKISSLFDISLGFEPEANGWENILIRSYLQGETPDTIKPKVQAIADFTELGDFLNMPVRHYSAGMLMRLAFSVATAMEPEVLLLDEVFSVGDMAFQTKARNRMTELLSRAKILVMVSHDLTSLASVCDKVLWLEHGRVRQLGPTKDVISAYTDHVQHQQPIAKAAA